MVGKQTTIPSVIYMNTENRDSDFYKYYRLVRVAQIAFFTS